MSLKNEDDHRTEDDPPNGSQQLANALVCEVAWLSLAAVVYVSWCNFFLQF